MSAIAKILVPIYECRDNYPAYEHALWLAKTFGAALLIVGVVDKVKFVRLIPTPPAGLGAILDDKAVKEFHSELNRKTDALTEQAIQLGISADNMMMDPEALIDGTRQCDIMVESRLHRRTFFARKLFGKRDIYTDACCPILVTKGEPFTMTRVLLIYNQTEQANRGLRWLIRLFMFFRDYCLAKKQVNAEDTGILNLRVLVLWRNDQERERLLSEVDAFAKAHSVDVQLDAVAAKDGFCGKTKSSVAFCRTVELVKKLQPSIVAMPMYTFSRPLRLRINGIDMKALNDIQASVLLFT